MRQYNSKNIIILPLQPAFHPSLFTPSVGVKSAIGGTFSALREPISAHDSSKNHFSSLSIFRSDNVIFHNKDNISMSYK